jgi:ATP-dependent protease Clp ATPase subunit
MKYCPFCEKAQNDKDVRFLVARGPAAICDMCVARCVKVIAEYSRKKIDMLKEIVRSLEADAEIESIFGSE